MIQWLGRDSTGLSCPTNPNAGGADDQSTTTTNRLGNSTLLGDVCLELREKCSRWVGVGRIDLQRSDCGSFSLHPREDLARQMK
jgi:hypothetical protein